MQGLVAAYPMLSMKGRVAVQPAVSRVLVAAWPLAVSVPDIAERRRRFIGYVSTRHRVGRGSTLPPRKSTEKPLSSRPERWVSTGYRLADA
eukprot:3583051-Rhodomonas_salina.3